MSTMGKPPLSKVRQRVDSTKMRLRVGVDTGGTFTDLVAADEGTGQLIVAKSPNLSPNVRIALA